MREIPETLELTYLSKTNITQTLIYVKEAQSYLQEQMAKELFEQKNKADFLKLAESSFYENHIVNDFVVVLENFATSTENAIGMFNKLQEIYPFGDIYDAIESNFVFYFLSVNVDIETYTDAKIKEQLQAHYNDVHACYSDIILFIKNNKI